MDLIPIDILPSRKANCEYKNIRSYLMEFMQMNVKYARVEYTQKEFLNIPSARSSISGMIRQFNFPVRTRVLNDTLYLERTDMED